MLIFTPTEPDVPSHLSAKLRNLPTLIEVYVLLVDQVMRKHGFDPDRGEFVVEQALPGIDHSEENSTEISDVCWPEVSRIDFVSGSLRAGWAGQPEPKMTCEADLLVAAF